MARRPSELHGLQDITATSSVPAARSSAHPSTSRRFSVGGEGVACHRRRGRSASTAFEGVTPSDIVRRTPQRAKTFSAREGAIEDLEELQELAQSSPHWHSVDLLLCGAVAPAPVHPKPPEDGDGPPPLDVKNGSTGSLQEVAEDGVKSESRRSSSSARNNSKLAPRGPVVSAVHSKASDDDTHELLDVARLKSAETETASMSDGSNNGQLVASAATLSDSNKKGKKVSMLSMSLTVPTLRPSNTMGSSQSRHSQHSVGPTGWRGSMQSMGESFIHMVSLRSSNTRPSWMQPSWSMEDSKFCRDSGVRLKSGRSTVSSQEYAWGWGGSRATEEGGVPLTQCFLCQVPFTVLRGLNRVRYFGLYSLTRFLTSRIKLDSETTTVDDGTEAEDKERKEYKVKSSLAKAEDAFQNELLDACWEEDSDTVSDIGEHGWQEYFVHHRNTPRSVWELAAGVPCSEFGLMRKLGIKPTLYKDMRELLRGLKGNMLSLQDGQDSDMDAILNPSDRTNNDLAEVLGDSRVEWCYYDLFEIDCKHDEPLARFMISGFSSLARLSQEMLLFIAFYSIWYCTLTFCFREVIAVDLHFGPSSLTHKTCTALDVSFDGVYVIGVLMQLRTTLIDAQKFTEMTRVNSVFWLTLRSTWFWTDLLTSSLTPLRCFFGLSSNASLHMCLIKVLRGWRLCHVTQDPVKSTRWWLMIMLKYVFFLLLAGHIWGCAWFVLVEEFSIDIQKHPLVVGAGRESVFADTSWALALYYSYAWRIGIYIVLGVDWMGMTGGENFVSALTAPIGALISAYVFSQVIIVMQRESAIQTLYAKHVIEVKQALATLDLPRYLQLRILAFYAYQQLHRSEHTSESLRRALSPQLNFELHLVLYYGLVKRSKLFQSAPPRVLREIVVVLNDRIFLPGDYVLRVRDEATEMFFICKGSCSVLDRDLKTSHKVLHCGESFGEIALLCGTPHQAYIRTDTYCILAILGKAHFDVALRFYPKMAEIMLKQMSQQERELMAMARPGTITRRRSQGSMLRFSKVGSGIFGPSGQESSIQKLQEMMAHAGQNEKDRRVSTFSTTEASRRGSVFSSKPSSRPGRNSMSSAGADGETTNYPQIRGIGSLLTPGGHTQDNVAHSPRPTLIPGVRRSSTTGGLNSLLSPRASTFSMPGRASNVGLGSGIGMSRPGREQFLTSVSERIHNLQSSTVTVGSRPAPARRSSTFHNTLPFTAPTITVSVPSSTQGDTPNPVLESFQRSPQPLSQKNATSHTAPSVSPRSGSPRPGWQSGASSVSSGTPRRNPDSLFAAPALSPVAKGFAEIDAKEVATRDDSRTTMPDEVSKNPGESASAWIRSSAQNPSQSKHVESDTLKSVHESPAPVISAHAPDGVSARDSSVPPSRAEPEQPTCSTGDEDMEIIQLDSADEKAMLKTSMKHSVPEPVISNDHSRATSHSSDRSPSPCSHHATPRRSYSHVSKASGFSGAPPISISFATKQDSTDDVAQASVFPYTSEASYEAPVKETSRNSHKSLTAPAGKGSSLVPSILMHTIKHVGNMASALSQHASRSPSATASRSGSATNSRRGSVRHTHKSKGDGHGSPRPRHSVKNKDGKCLVSESALLAQRLEALMHVGDASPRARDGQDAPFLPSGSVDSLDSRRSVHSTGQPSRHFGARKSHDPNLAHAKTRAPSKSPRIEKIKLRPRAKSFPSCRREMKHWRVEEKPPDPLPKKISDKIDLMTAPKDEAVAAYLQSTCHVFPAPNSAVSSSRSNSHVALAGDTGASAKDKLAPTGELKDASAAATQIIEAKQNKDAPPQDIVPAKESSQIKEVVPQSHPAFAGATETVASATASMKCVLKDLTLVHAEMETLHKTAKQVLQELQESLQTAELPQDELCEGQEQEKLKLEVDVEHGGFGTFEVAQAVDIMLRQLKHLQTMAETIAAKSHGADGVDGVLAEAFFSDGGSTG